MAAPADTATLTVVADRGVHRGLTVNAAPGWPTARVRAALLDEVAVHDVPCYAASHRLAVRSKPNGWMVVIECQDEGVTIHPPTKGMLEVIQQERTGQ